MSGFVHVPTTDDDDDVSLSLTSPARNHNNHSHNLNNIITTTQHLRICRGVLFVVLVLCFVSFAYIGVFVGFRSAVPSSAADVFLATKHDQPLVSCSQDDTNDPNGHKRVEDSGLLTRLLQEGVNSNNSESNDRGQNLTCVCRETISDGVWIDNIWVWNQPGQSQCNHHHMSPREAQHVMTNECIVVLGDSVSRQLAYTMGSFWKSDKKLNSDVLQFDQKHGLPETYDVLSVIQISPPTPTTCLEFRWAPKFPEIIKQTESLSSKTTVFVVGFGSWMTEVDGRSAILKYDLIALVNAMCAQEGSKRFVIRSPTLSTIEHKNKFLAQLSRIISSLIFDGSNTVCCGAHRIFFLDSQRMLLEKSQPDDRPRALDSSSFHWPAIIRAQMAQSVFNLITWSHPAPIQFEEEDSNNSNNKNENQQYQSKVADRCCTPARLRVERKIPEYNELLRQLRPGCDPSRMTIPFTCSILSHHNSLLAGQGGLLRWRHNEFKGELPHAAFLAKLPPNFSKSGLAIWVLAAHVTKKSDLLFSWYLNGKWISEKFDGRNRWQWLRVGEWRTERDGVEVMLVLNPRDAHSAIFAMFLGDNPNSNDEAKQVFKKANEIQFSTVFSTKPASCCRSRFLSPSCSVRSQNNQLVLENEVLEWKGTPAKSHAKNLPSAVFSFDKNAKGGVLWVYVQAMNLESNSWFVDGKLWNADETLGEDVWSWQKVRKIRGSEVTFSVASRNCKIGGVLLAKDEDFDPLDTLPEIFCEDS